MHMEEEESHRTRHTLLASDPSRLVLYRSEKVQVYHNLALRLGPKFARGSCAATVPISLRRGSAASRCLVLQKWRWCTVLLHL